MITYVVSVARKISALTLNNFIPTPENHAKGQINTASLVRGIADL